MPDQMPAAQPPDQGQSQGQSGMGFQDMSGAILKAMSMMGTTLQKAGVPPEGLKELAAIIQAFQGFVEKVAGGDQAQAEPTSPGQMETGGSPGAQPMSPMTRG